MYRKKKIFFFIQGGLHTDWVVPYFFFCLFQRWYNQKMAYYTYYYHRVHIYSSSSIETDCIRTANGYTTAFSTLIIPLHEKKRDREEKLISFCVSAVGNRK